MDYPYACWRKSSTECTHMSLLNKMIYYNTAVFCLRYESHANIGHRANARRPKTFTRHSIVADLSTITCPADISFQKTKASAHISYSKVIYCYTPVLNLEQFAINYSINYAN